MPHYFIAGIDTEVGKSIVTGLLAKWLLDRNVNVGTMKIVETGVAEGEISADIRTHRKIMGVGLSDMDFDGTTCPYRFRLPASPHLSAKLEGVKIEPQRIVDASLLLRKRFDTLLIEGVGGLMVPLTKDYLSVDFVQQIGSPVILVTSGKLGSINHTLLSLEALAGRKIPPVGLVYNHYDETADEIRRDSLELFRDCLEKIDRPGALVEIPRFKTDTPPNIDFSSLFGA